ncbi:MAG TPA: lipopolysaccharide assembly protein LapB [Burkholderiaceae bacterium]|nr:lipopolysaccharide assembly protein LapB [Burkholderiaceae bacterium]
MDFEPWWLISVPLLFGLGWIAARVDFRQMLSETRSMPKSYFKGLNFLLNEQPDRAIDAFIEVAKLDPETTELHFALGSLFRRRGEMERAIRVHQSLLARADLPAADREMAEHELAQDYLKAGMLDRAEAAFTAVQDTRYAVQATRALIRIHESSHEWPQAIAAVKRLRKLVDEPVPQLVHYHCEQAEAALAQQPPALPAARAALDNAEKAADRLPDSHRGQASEARIAMLRAQIAQIEGDESLRCHHLTSILDQAPSYGSLVAPDIMACHHQLGLADQGLERLLTHYQQHPDLDTFNVLFQEKRAREGYEPAWQFVRQALQQHPTLLGLDRVLESELALEHDGQFADFDLLRRIIHRHTRRLDRYACQQCGFEARHYYWQCPGCNGWETYAPRRIEELA